MEDFEKQTLRNNRKLILADFVQFYYNNLDLDFWEALEEHFNCHITREYDLEENEDNV